MLEKEHNHLVNESDSLTDLVAELQSMKRLLEEEKVRPVSQHGTCCPASLRRRASLLPLLNFSLYRS